MRSLAKFLTTRYNYSMANQKTVTNEELMEIMRDMMQMTSDKFDQVDKRFDQVDVQVSNLTGEVKELRNASYRHEVELGKQTRLIESARDEVSNIHVDLNEIIHRITELERKDKLNGKERAEAQTKLQQLIDWAKLASKQIGVPLKFT